MDREPHPAKPERASPAFFARLNACLVNDLSRFRTGLVGPDDPRSGMRASELLDTTRVTAIIARFDDKFGKTDPRAVMSMWASAYFTDAIPPLLTANIMLDLSPELGFDRVEFIMSATLRIEAVRIEAELLPLIDYQGHTRFYALVINHLAPLIDLIAQRGGVTRRVLWSNAGNVFEAFTRKLEMTFTKRPGFEHAHELLASKSLANGQANPLYEAVRYIEGRRVRRICCMRYLIPNEKVCGVCPLGPDNPARVPHADLED